MNKAFYAGTFNPFTVGHQSMVERALRLFDGVVIGVGYNINKPDADRDAALRAISISALYGGDPRVEVVCYGTLTTRAAAKHGADVLLRGVRDCADFEYERNIAEINRRISGMETVILFALPELACVSSSMVRELKAFGQDVTDFLPHPGNK